MLGSIPFLDQGIGEGWHRVGGEVGAGSAEPDCDALRSLDPMILMKKTHV